MITGKFVVIYYPKTGTTFLRAALRSALEDDRFPGKLLRRLGLAPCPYTELLLPKLYGDYDESVRDRHGVVRQIPTEDRGKPIVSTVRNPLTKYTSSYVYGWWKEHPPFEVGEVRRVFPEFPDLSFSAFYNMLNHPRVNEDRLKVDSARLLGSYTRMFLVFFSEDPDVAAKKLADGAALRSVLPEITFLRQENLRSDLEIFLKDRGFSSRRRRRIDFVGDQNIGSPEKKEAIPREELASVAKAILRDERHLLDAFPAYLEGVEVVAGGRGP